MHDHGEQDNRIRYSKNAMCNSLHSIRRDGLDSHPGVGDSRNKRGNARVRAAVKISLTG
jgi:hypothetical protein